MDRDRCLCVVVENPPVGEQQPPDVQFEQRVAQWLIYRSRPRRSGHVCRTVLFHADVHVWLLENQLVQRNSAAPEGIDAQTCLHFLRGKKRFRARALLPVDHQTLDGCPHGEPLNRQSAQLHLAAGHPFQTAYQQAAQQRVARAAPEENHQSRDNQEDLCAENPGDVTQPAPLPAAGLARHFDPPSRRISMCRRALLSFNHFSAWSLIPLCTRASWIASRAASSDGGSCPRALACGMTAFS